VPLISIPNGINHFYWCFCIPVNFTKICQAWRFMIVFELTYKSMVPLSWGPRFCTWKFYFSFFGAWFMICFAVQHRYYQSRTKLRRWSTSISRWTKSWYRTRSLTGLHSCWRQVWNRGGPISVAVASTFFYFYFFYFLLKCLPLRRIKLAICCN